MVPLHYACILLLSFVAGLIGFDCSGHGLNIILLLHIGNCELAEIETSKEETYVQLLQLSDYERTRIQQCKVEVAPFFTVACTYTSLPYKTVAGYICKRRSNTACQRLHETGTLSLGRSAIISGASPNSTITSSINFAGSTTGWTLFWNNIAMGLGIRWLCKPLLKSSSKTSRFLSNVHHHN